MKNTKYSFFGQLYRYSGFYALFMLTVCFIIVQHFENEPIRFPVSLTVYLFFVMLWSIYSLWIHPWVKIEDNGILISRLFFVRRKAKWINVKINKKLRTNTRSRLIGLDPRYVRIDIKDGILLDKYIFILPFFKDYDEFVTEIEKHLNPDDIITDKNYY